MPIPDYETLMLPVLRLFDEGASNVADCVSSLKAEFDVTDDEGAELLPSGRVPRVMRFESTSSAMYS
ncbi:winged helix-turn-helix domain-containing protein [Paracoccus shandongensis]|uniref:winged helix-turn-helix domain-containing protein n=1 Tax=Paracoccus shandongensis TaxID=2816048 RepID=UPI001A8F8141|nr:winged helix-turn-helix domain-containing protein [Paracoccus shandongensis]